MNRKQLTYVLGAVVIVAAAVVVYFSYFSGGGGAVDLLAGAETTKIELRPTDNIHGSPNAPVTIVEYASMTCPHCAAFQKEVVPQLTKDYIDTGKVKMVFREFPLDPGATMASALARCMKGDAYFAFIDLLFNNQDKWWYVLFKDPQHQVTKDEVADNLVEMAKIAGMGRDQALTCMNDKANLDLVQANWEEGKDRYQVNSTPSIFINGDIHRGEVTFDAIKKEIDADLAKH